MSTKNPNACREIMEFLADRSRTELRVSDADHSHLIIRSPFDDETDFLFIVTGYGAGNDPHRLDCVADFAGLYSRSRGVIVSPCYYLRQLVDGEHMTLLPDEVRAVENRAAELVCQAASRGPVPETDEAYEPYDDEDHFEKYGLESEARTCFMDDTFPCFEARVEANDFHEAVSAARIINHPEEAAAEYAARYLVKNAKRINQRLSRLPRIALRLAQLTTTPGNHHLVRAISQSVHDEKMVRMDVEKGGKQLSVRIEASVLKRTETSYYSTYYMDAPSRRAFESAFGKGADLSPGDIARIAHGNKTLYEKCKVSPADAMEVTPDQFALICRAENNAA